MSGFRVGAAGRDFGIAPHTAPSHAFSLEVHTSPVMLARLGLEALFYKQGTREPQKLTGQGQDQTGPWPHWA